MFVIHLILFTFFFIVLDERMKWTAFELKEVRTYFASYFDGTAQRRCPGIKECQEAILQSRLHNGTLHRRKWASIKKKVSYLMHSVQK